MRVRMFLFLVPLMLIVGCRMQPVSVSMAETDSREWDARQAVEIFYENNNTISLKNIDALVRFERGFGYDKLGLAITTIDPVGYRWCDTVYVNFPENTSRTKLHIETRQPYRTAVRFALKGRYMLRLSPVMSSGSAEGVAAAGVDIY